jgi:ribosome-associated toxin RatA of RatAB toxin-antitoxin module
MRTLGLTAFVALSVAGSSARADEWKLYSDKDGLRIELRTVEGSSVKEVRAEAVVDAPADAIFRVLADVESYPGVMPPTVGARRLHTDGKATWYHMVIDPPVVSKRDYCLKITMSQHASGVLTSEFVVDNDDSTCPAAASGVVRMVKNRGVWTLTPVDEHHTRVVYQAHTDPGGSVPGWIVNSQTGKTMPKIFAQVMKASVSPHYAKK